MYVNYVYQHVKYALFRLLALDVASEYDFPWRLACSDGHASTAMLGTQSTSRTAHIVRIVVIRGALAPHTSTYLAIWVIRFSAELGLIET